MYLEFVKSGNVLWFFDVFIFWYAVSIMSAYIILAIISTWAINEHLKENKSINFEQILSSPLAPKIAIIAPAFNESASIVENVRSLLSLRYNKFEIIIVNDGSTDASISILIEAYDLVPSEHFVFSEIEHKEIKQVYRSTNKAFKNLLVIDKENGGKADSLNAGINSTDAKYVANIDVDCIIEKNALLRMVEPFLQETEYKMIATGGVIRIANNCEIRNGDVAKVRVPKSLLAKFQTLEYLRSFLLGRMGWSKINGLMIISGAFGLFDKDVVIEAGGYSKNTVGEDMELVFRMRRLMSNKKIKHKVHYIPEPLCWTEVPESIKTLGRQRNRWTRGCAETLLAHKRLFFNPKFKTIGLISFPFWVFFEWLAPIIEFLGVIYFLVLMYFGWVNWSHFWLLVAFVYSFAVMISLYTIFIEELTFREYKGRSAQWKLIGAALLEPILFHPMVVWIAVKGNWDKFIRRKKVWGKQVRTGFGNT